MWANLFTPFIKLFDNTNIGNIWEFTNKMTQK